MTPSVHLEVGATQHRRHLITVVRRNLPIVPPFCRQNSGQVWHKKDMKKLFAVVDLGAPRLHRDLPIRRAGYCRADSYRPSAVCFIGYQEHHAFTQIGS